MVKCMRGLWKSGMVGLVLLGLVGTRALADEATVQALGNAFLVLEDETTVLSLFNLGNPAGAAFRPSPNRLDLTLQGGQRLASEEYTASPVDIVETILSSDTFCLDNPADPTGTTVTVQKIRTSYPNLDPNGNTLPAGMVFNRKRSTYTAGFLPVENLLYQGVFVKPAELFTLQLIPLATFRSLQTTDQSRQDDWQTGGGARASYQFLPNAAFGAGFTGTALGVNTPQQTAESQATGMEAGAAFRLAEVFDADDQLDVGAVFRGSLQTDRITGAAFPPYSQRSRPWLSEAHGVYSYKSLMDVSLQLGYLVKEDYREWPGQELLSSALRNLEYNLQFRVRLPMASEDDLRFGIAFNNRGVEHAYPTGTLETLDPDTLALKPRIFTNSSSIGIGAAVVPAEGSIISLEYHLSSSLSKYDQAEESLCDSGFTGFTLGVQYELLEGLTLRTHWADRRLTFQSRPLELVRTDTITTTSGSTTIESTVPAWEPSSNLLTQITYTRSFGFGVGIEDGPLSVNVAAVYDLITHSPEGWTFEDKPRDLKIVNQDLMQNLTGLVSVTWLF